ncbi:MAG TPA: cobalamin-binding protein [Steroidobacteraceae bacterium]|nr:cobalamin-binding protein [Steroidobacteraceae bacterium]
MQRLGEKAGHSLTARGCTTSQRIVAAAWLALSLVQAGAAMAAAPASIQPPIVDDTGRALPLAAPARRIVALAPGATALLFAAGAGDRVIATIQFADEPAAAQRVPRLGDLQSIDLERLLALRPDVVVVTEAITSPLMVDRVRELGLPVYTTRFTRLADIAPSVARLGQLAGTGAVADREAARLGTELARLRDTYAGRTSLTVLYQVWSHPIYTIGGSHIVTDALAICGARNAFASERVAAPSLSVEAVLARNPQVIVASGPGEVAKKWIAEWRRFPHLAAAAAGHLYVFDDPRLDRMGPSAIDATAGLCRILDAARARPVSRGNSRTAVVGQTAPSSAVRSRLAARRAACR